MGWTISDLTRTGETLMQARERHVRNATRYGAEDVRIIMHEWKPQTWFAIIGFYKNDKLDKAFLRVDKIEATATTFGYKDMCEEMGPHVDDAPSEAMKRAIYRYIPEATGYAADWRRDMGIKYNEPA